MPGELWDNYTKYVIKSSEQILHATLEMVALHTNRKYYWVCQRCGHSWKASPKNRATGKGCPNCAGQCVYPEINSFASVNPQMIDQWDIEKNYPLTAWKVTAYDNRDYHWVCKNGHSFSASPANRTKGTDCPYCKGKIPVVGVNDFAKICPTAAAEWHLAKNAHHLPEHFLPNSHEEVWWQCEAGHIFRAPIREMVLRWRCPHCERRRMKR